MGQDERTLQQIAPLAPLVVSPITLMLGALPSGGSCPTSTSFTTLGNHHTLHTYGVPGKSRTGL